MQGEKTYQLNHMGGTGPPPGQNREIAITVMTAEYR